MFPLMDSNHNSQTQNLLSCQLDEAEKLQIIFQSRVPHPIYKVVELAKHFFGTVNTLLGFKLKQIGVMI